MCWLVFGDVEVVKLLSVLLLLLLYALRDGAVTRRTPVSFQKKIIQKKKKKNHFSSSCAMICDANTFHANNETNGNGYPDSEISCPDMLQGKLKGGRGL